MGLHVGELFLTISLRDHVISPLQQVLAKARASSPLFASLMDGMGAAASAMGDAITSAAKRAGIALAEMALEAVLSGSRLGDAVLGIMHSLGGLGGVISKVSAASHLFTGAMGTMGVAARFFGSESGRSFLRVAAVLALLVAAVIIARKVINGELGAMRGAFLALSPVALAVHLASTAIGKAFDAIRPRIQAAAAGVAAGVRGMWASTEEMRDRVTGAFERVRSAMTALGRAQTAWSVISGTVRMSSRTVLSALGTMSTGLLNFGSSALTATPMVLGMAAKSGMALAGIGVAGVAMGGVLAGVFAGITAGIAVIGIKAAMESAKVKAAFADLKKSVQADLAQAASVLEGPLTQAAGSLKAMFSSQIAPALQQMFTQIAPLIGQFTAGLSQFLTPMLPAIQGVVGAVAPMLSALAGSLGTFGSQLAGFLAPISAALQANSGLLATFVTGLGGVLQAIGPLLGVLVELAGSLTGPLMSGLTLIAQTLAGQLGPALSQLSPVLGGMITSFAQLAAALIPLLPPVLQLVAAFASSLMPVLVQVGQTLATALLPVITQLRPMITLIGTAFGQLVTALLPLLPPIAQLVTALITGLVPAITPLLPMVGQIAAALGGVLVQAISVLVAAITPLLPPISEMAVLFGQTIQQAIVALSPIFTQLATIIGQLIAAVLPLLPPIMQLATSLLPPLVQLVTTLSPILLGLATIFTKIVSAVTPFLPPLIELGSSVLPLVISIVTALAKVLTGDFQGAWDTIKKGVQQFAQTITSAFKKLWTLGSDLVAGIKNGFVNAWNSFTSAVGNLFSGFISWIKNLLGIASPSTVMAGIGSDTAKGWVQGLLGQEQSIKDTAGKLTNAVLSAFKSGSISEGVKDTLVEAVQAGNTRLQALAKEREQIAKTLADAMAYVSQVSDQVRDWASLSSLGLGSGQGQQPVTAQNIEAGLQARLARVRTFANVIKKLAKRGLSKSLLQQVIEAGPDGGVELGQAILEADAATFKSINSAAGMIDKAAKQAGKNAADALFDAGKNAGKGFLTGLTSQKKQIEAAMKDIANALVAQIKKQLKIKSPSRVLADIGVNTVAGMVTGMNASAAAVVATARSIAGQVATGLTPAAGLGSTGQKIAARGSAAPVTVNVTNNYPQAEPTSRTVNRGLQYASMLGLV
ncbi:hypothetical protein AB0K18_42770 [Nonomuraea sp. NPDC049421]|uniref:phage tail protein n=1 Tax=Nonomuraea sp. NPDC049421 TaxID=3155275 RepID=UPI003413DD27